MSKTGVAFLFHLKKSYINVLHNYDPDLGRYMQFDHCERWLCFLPIC